MRFNSSLVLRAAVLASFSGGVAQAQDVIRIGHVAATSGVIAHLGKDNENGARMAVDELNAKGVLIGGKRYRVEMLAEDDAGDPKQGTTVAQKLVDAKVRGVIGHETSGTTIPASKIYFDAGIPQISPSASNPKYTRQGFNTAFRNVANDEQLGAALAKYAVQTGKARQIAVIDDRTAYGKGLADEFIKNVKSAGQGARVVSQQYTTDKATDFGAILTAIKATKPDLVFFGGMDAVAGPMLRQMKQLGMPLRFMGGDGLCSDSLAKLAGEGMADGQVICAEAGGVDAQQQKGMDDFRAAYRRRYGIDVMTYAPYAYDAMHAMVAAMQQAGSTDPAVYLPALAKVRHKGVTGVTAFDARGDVKDGRLTLFTFKSGKRQRLSVIQ
ncbi:branched-chain amino acid ABC transporter substrate-binding protein [Massilia pseudoviolaceinigra]|uniref:branched-chain amino acid ABC transporter substrate-binding protein n=1 Tax=Massilia pseudoviolaceinigra TaxID=3057165 RepID=UPI0027964B93|nr:branched-chain amino acid ABC transporter substrate-binding protein [Massilia sp. CCM 9206]MDQ1919362.1 branched-chain amino acid ABC transporter substrate-binding protein [Massilia sp. CCM 9206]